MITTLRKLVVAEVTVGDDYRVELRTRRKLTDLHPDEAVQLAQELVDAAADSRAMLKQDHEGRETHVHGFDACRDGVMS